MYIHACIYIHICMYTYIYTYTYVYILDHIWCIAMHLMLQQCNDAFNCDIHTMCIYIYTFTYIHINIYMYAYVYTWTPLTDCCTAMHFFASDATLNSTATYTTCVCIHTHIYMHICTYICICIYLETVDGLLHSNAFDASGMQHCFQLRRTHHMYIFMYVHTHTYVYIYIYTCIYMCIYIYLNAVDRLSHSNAFAAPAMQCCIPLRRTHHGIYICIHTHIPTYIYIYMYIYMYIHTLKRSWQIVA